MRNCLIYIGNGFDLALNKKTRYSDFIKSQLFRELLLRNNKLAIFMEKKHKFCDWNNVEEMLFEYSLEIEKNYGSDNVEENTRFRKEHQLLSLSLQNYIARQTIETSNLTNLINSWNRYLKIIKICSFNYTPEPVLNHLLFDYDKLNRIHGSCIVGCTNDELSIVLGIDRCMKVCKEHEFLYKDNQSLRFDCRDNYMPKKPQKEIIRETFNIPSSPSIFESIEVIIIYGCSFGRSDTAYYEYLLCKALNKKIIIYHFGNNDKLQIKNRINEITDNSFPVDKIVFIDDSICYGYRKNFLEILNQ